MSTTVQEPSSNVSTLILGGARSGKSRYASALALEMSPTPVLVATAQPLDAEMAERIALHQRDRSAAWTTLECPLDVVAALTELSEDQTVVVDCLTLWLSNLMHQAKDVTDETQRLCDYVQTSRRRLIFVSNEVGLGLVPETPLGRSFRDAQGRLNQALAAVADEVYFVAAGLPLQLK
ncbi:MAG: bifunctional adenosylcobinamide kinase/adenosylcobinamide-phosphate guanylyltransferase [Pseudomonadota bacterium]